MVQKTYTNNINEMEVSIAIERLAIALYPNTAFSAAPTRTNVDSLPAGFFDLGAVVEDTPSFKVSRNMFALDTGIPAITQYQAVVGLEGSFEVSLHSESWRKIQYALGNYTVSAQSTTVVGTISSVIDRNTFIVGVSSLNGITTGRQITVATSANMNNPDVIETWVSSMSTISSGVYIMYAGATPIRTPTVNLNVGIYTYAKNLVGTAKLTNYTLLGFADMIDDTQVIHYFAKAQPMGEWAEELRPGQNQRTKLGFKAFGYTTTAPDGTDQLIVAERYFFPKGT